MKVWVISGYNGNGVLAVCTSARIAEAWHDENAKSGLDAVVIKGPFEIVIAVERHEDCGEDWVPPEVLGEHDPYVTPDSERGNQPDQSITPCCGKPMMGLHHGEYPLVMWNPGNKVVSCHACGETWEPMSKERQAEMEAGK